MLPRRRAVAERRCGGRTAAAAAMPADVALPMHCPPSPPHCHQAAAAGELPLPPPPPPPPRCHRTSCRGAAANDAALPPRCQAGRPATALPPPLPLPRYCRHRAIAANLLPRCPPPPPCCRCRCRAATVVATPPAPLPCCRRHRRAAAASALTPPPPPRAIQAQVVLGKTEGMVDGWCWGWRGGVADYWDTKNKKGEGKKNLACGPG